ncbi:hypothetical protein Hanom_Chr14g01312881 [Helianthus anomalus]
MTTGSSFGSGCKQETGVPDQFLAGLRVLVVDDDVICLKILEQMLRVDLVLILVSDLVVYLSGLDS